MPESTTLCPNCGNQLEPNTPVCPYCGAQQPQPPAGFVGKLQAALDGILATTRTHPAYWMAGGGVAGVAVIAAVVVFGGFLGPSGKQICTASLNLARDYGVISPSATLASNSAESTDVKGRKSCTAQADSDKFTLLVDVKKVDDAKKPCKDFVKQSGCVALYSVARTDGMTTYQVRAIPPDETDEALAAENPAAAPAAGGAGAADSAQDSGGIDSDTAVDNSGSMPAAPAQPAPAQQPQGDQPQQ